MNKGHKTLAYVVPVSLFTAFLISYWFSIPPLLFKDPFSTVLEDRSGELLGARIAADGQWRFPPLDSVPEKYVRCLIHYEDRHFYHHPGFNPFSLARAFRQNLKSGEIVSGGSTLSMQVIRLSRKGRSRTLWQKIIEILLATRLEVENSKNSILAIYASHAPFGGNVVGLDAASWRYFGRSPWDLTLAESATLAVLPNSPSLIHPGRNRESLLGKRNLLLASLLEKGLIDTLDYIPAVAEPLPPDPLPLPTLAPHLLDYFYLNHNGKRIRSTLEAGLQEKLTAMLEYHHRQLEFNQIHNAACLILNTGNGEVLAYCGNVLNRDSGEHSGNVDIIRSPRSTGSILKPLLFCLMLEEGDILPGTLVPDIPTQYTGYSPKNFDLEYGGAVPARRALARSLNIPSVRMLQSYGLEKFHYHLSEMGMQTMDKPAEHYGLSLILGGAEASLWWITGMYASMGRILLHYNQSQGYFNDDFHPPVLIHEAQESPGKRQKVNPHPVSAASVWLTFESLKEVNRPETQTGWQAMESSTSLAWKTGTSFGFRDGWAVGTSPAYTVGVWIGNADGEGRPVLTGIYAAAPVLFDVFQSLSPSPWFGEPSAELLPVRVCRQSGYLPGPNCIETDTVLVPSKGLHSPPCPYHFRIHLTLDGRFRVNTDCMPLDSMKHESRFVLPPVQEWYYRSNNPHYLPLPGIHPDCRDPGEIPVMEMIYPRHSARVVVPRELDGSPGKILLESAHRRPSQVIHWHLNERYLGSTRYIHQMGISPEPGQYRLTLVDESGSTLQHHFEVVSVHVQNQM